MQVDPHGDLRRRVAIALGLASIPFVAGQDTADQQDT
jgi:hypothetical protein